MDKRVSLNAALDAEKVAFQIVKKIRDGILEETFKPQGRLIEQDLAERFNVSRSPVREALLALEKEGTVIISPYKGRDRKATLSGRSLGHCGTPVSPHLSGGQAGAPSPLPG
jgi:hypothetical protein